MSHAEGIGDWPTINIRLPEEMKDALRREFGSNRLQVGLRAIILAYLWDWDVRPTVQQAIDAAASGKKGLDFQRITDFMKSYEYKRIVELP